MRQEARDCHHKTESGRVHRDRDTVYERLTLCFRVFDRRERLERRDQTKDRTEETGRRDVREPESTASGDLAE